MCVSVCARVWVRLWTLHVHVQYVLDVMWAKVLAYDSAQRDMNVVVYTYTYVRSVCMCVIHIMCVLYWVLEMCNSLVRTEPLLMLIHTHT